MDRGKDGPWGQEYEEIVFMQLTESHRHYWRKNLNITAWLLLAWFVATYVVSFLRAT